MRRAEQQRSVLRWERFGEKIYPRLLTHREQEELHARKTFTNTFVAPYYEVARLVAAIESKDNKNLRMIWNAACMAPWVAFYQADIDEETYNWKVIFFMIDQRFIRLEVSHLMLNDAEVDWSAWMIVRLQSSLRDLIEEQYPTPEEWKP